MVLTDISYRSKRGLHHIPKDNFLITFIFWIHLLIRRLFILAHNLKIDIEFIYAVY